ncbi:unnamed protein product [Tetraodon nigroviridis]|uniref:Chromosome 1 SCAF14573, whole genome shotgun sequence n=1 Tax=Tetraodon nigroviridis TaxID=99883 RepID=Q4SJT4_TETNG|nr:unnamed protein product [Tetraodon nigroviridis]
MAGNPDSNGDKADGSSVTHFRSYLHGGMSSLLTTVPTIVVFPVYKTVFRQQTNNSSICQALRQMKKEGLPKLYRGVVPPILQRTLTGTVLFGVQDTFHHQLSLLNVFPRPALPALAGLGTGVVEALVLTPFERVQNLLQNNQNDRKLPNIRRVLAELNKQGPALGFYRAFLPTAVRNALGSTLYFGLKGPIYDAVHAQGLPPLVASFASGTLASWPITFVVFPMSVLVANMQKHVEGEAKSAMACWGILWKDRQRKHYTDTSHLLRRPTLHTPAPDQSQKSARMSDNPVKQEVENFNRRSLKKTETKMNTSLPTKEDIEQEKQAQKEQK